jgi:UDP-N-acetylmuramoyl-tripeptide--D-alanyl-D-alanine ligase
MFFAYKRSVKACQFFQQEGYAAWDFTKFIFHRFRFIDKRLSLCVLAYSIFSVGRKDYAIDAAVLAALFAIFGLRHGNPLAKSRPKKKFEMTSRAKRILGLSLAIDLAIAWRLFGYLDDLSGAGLYCLCRVTGYLILFIQSLPFVLELANLLLSPVEHFIKRKYYNEARAKLEKLKPTVIGITGSFGKTSTKNILAHILGPSALATARSINTLMGIVRVAREELKPSHEYFIAEIGTSAPDKVAKICTLVRPRHAILTAVGNMHYAYFKSQEAVAKEKFSIFETVREQGGVAVVNRTQVDGKYIKEFIGDYRNAAFLTQEKPDDASYGISDARVARNGVEFKLAHEGKTWALSAPVYGIHQTKDIALAFIMARSLGMASEKIVAALKTLPQTRHRQEVIHRADGITVVDDAYNSNVDGFVSALETARIIAGKGRAILVTPGMLELGKLHDEYHIRAASKALETMDVTILVKPARIREFAETFRHGMKSGQELVLANSYAEAEAWLKANQKKGDTLLYENDLADVYEEEIRI